MPINVSLIITVDIAEEVRILTKGLKLLALKVYVGINMFWVHVKSLLILSVSPSLILSCGASVSLPIPLLLLIALGRMKDYCKSLGTLVWI